MPRTAFAPSVLNSASPGLGKLAMAIGGGGDAAFEKGQNDGLTLQSKVAQAIAATQASAAAARLHGAQADQEEQQATAMRPDAVLAGALTSNGIPTDEAGAVGQYLKSGALGGKYAADPEGYGPVLPQPAWVDKLGTVARSIGTTGRAIALGDKNVENAAKADSLGRTDALADGVLAGKVNPTLFAQSQYAAKGSAPFSFHEFGTGNNLTGAVDDTNGPAQRFGQLRTAETGAAKGREVASYAAAAHSNASTAKTKQEMEQGGKTGTLQVVTDAEGNITVVDKANRTASPVTGPDGKPLQGKGQNLNGEQANALTFATRMQAAHDILTKLGDQGVLRGGNIKGTAEGLGHAVPIVGDALGQAAGAATNWTQSPAQQQVEQAKRDFVNAVLRRESGAAISMGEFKNADQQYFPQIGDSKAVIQQKAAARERVINGMMQAVPLSRRPPPAAAPVANPQSGGASGGWGGPAPSGSGWSIERVGG